jgi:hypothetical protein
MQRLLHYPPMDPSLEHDVGALSQDSRSLHVGDVVGGVRDITKDVPCVRRKRYTNALVLSIEED